MRQATILHADLDAFYASVEQLLDPSLRNRPIAVGGSSGGGVVLAASYEARRFGVHGAMSGRAAKALCPNLVFVGGHFDEYQRFGDRVVDMFHDITPLVERISIDEAFLDVSGATHLFGTPAVIAESLRTRVRNEIGLPISIGVATTKHLAKVASQVAKPDGLVVVDGGTERAFLEPLPIGLLWGVGKVTEKRLYARGIRTIGELAVTQPGTLNKLLGHATTEILLDRANNRDPRVVQTVRRSGSVGAQSACGRKLPTESFLVSTFGYLADRVSRRMRAKDLVGRTITVRVRFPDLRAVTRSLTFDEPTAETVMLRDHCVSLARLAIDENPHETHLSLLGISVSQLVQAGAAKQLAFCFQEPPRPDVRPEAERGRAVDAAVDGIRARFGNASIDRWSTATGAKGIDEQFRALAER